MLSWDAVISTLHIMQYKIRQEVFEIILWTLSKLLPGKSVCCTECVLHRLFFRDIMLFSWFPTLVASWKHQMGWVYWAIWVHIRLQEWVAINIKFKMDEGPNLNCKLLSCTCIYLAKPYNYLLSLTLSKAEITNLKWALVNNA